MMIEPFSNSLKIEKYKFNRESLRLIEENLWDKKLWPLVYILSDEKTKEAYIGESTDAISRLTNHLLNSNKNFLSSLHIITSDKFNKSATLDIEANLISYMSGDGKFKLKNGNAGLANHNYYQKDEYLQLFKLIWSELKSENLTIQSLKEIDNSDLFKYSPYKTLTNEQYNSVKQIIEVLVNGSNKSIVVDGSAGTGKTIVAIFLIKLLVTNIENLIDLEDTSKSDQTNLLVSLKKKYPHPKVALVVPMTSLRNTLKKVFKNINGLSANMVVGPTNIVRDEYDILIVDEAHRLKRRKNLTGYGAFDNANKLLGFDKEGTALDWIQKQCDHHILFYDANQSIKPSDIKKERFDSLIQKSIVIKLQSQLRVKGGNDYINYIDKLLNVRIKEIEQKFESKDYEFELFDSIQSLRDKITQKDEEFGLSRLVAGFSWEWKSKKDNTIYDINIEGIDLRWNSEPKDWINSANAKNEVGCIHTTQGYDLNYTGVIFGNEISYDPIKKEIIILPENYHDKKGKGGIKDNSILKSYIINIYKTLMFRGIKGTYVYVCDDKLRAYFERYIKPNQTEKKINRLSFKDVKPFINSVPLYNIYAAAGEFSELQLPSDFEWIQLQEPYIASEDYFVCKVVGESMNKVIPSGSFCLFKKDSGGSRNGKIVLVQHYSIQESDFGAGYTVKEYNSKKIEDEVDKSKWKHQSIILKPKSYDDSFQDISLKDDELESLSVMGIFICVIN